jgi:transposase-like protein
MTELRWPDGKVRCPTCGTDKVAYLEKACLWKCYAKHPCAKFSLKVGTILEDSPIGLNKWLPAMWLIANCKNGISSWELHRALGVTQKTAWFMLQRIRLAMQEKGTVPFSGSEVEADETSIGGLARNMHKNKKDKITRTGDAGKAVVMGLCSAISMKRRSTSTNGRTMTPHASRKWRMQSAVAVSRIRS